MKVKKNDYNQSSLLVVKQPVLRVLRWYDWRPSRRWAMSILRFDLKRLVKPTGRVLAHPATSAIFLMLWCMMIGPLLSTEIHVANGKLVATHDILLICGFIIFPSAAALRNLQYVMDQI